MDRLRSCDPRDGTRSGSARFPRAVLRVFAVLILAGFSVAAGRPAHAIAPAATSHAAAGCERSANEDLNVAQDAAPRRSALEPIRPASLLIDPDKDTHSPTDIVCPAQSCSPLQHFSRAEGKRNCLWRDSRDRSYDAQAPPAA